MVQPNMQNTSEFASGDLFNVSAKHLDFNYTDKFSRGAEKKCQHFLAMPRAVNTAWQWNVWFMFFFMFRHNSSGTVIREQWNL